MECYRKERCKGTEIFLEDSLNRLGWRMVVRGCFGLRRLGAQLVVSSNSRRDYTKPQIIIYTKFWFDRIVYAYSNNKVMMTIHVLSMIDYRRFFFLPVHLSQNEMVVDFKRIWKGKRNDLKKIWTSWEGQRIKFYAGWGNGKAHTTLFASKSLLLQWIVCNYVVVVID